MLTLQYLKENKEELISRLKIKNFKAGELVNQILEKDEARRLSQSKANDLQAEMNQISKEIGLLFKEGKQQEANQAKTRTSEIKEAIKELTTSMQNAANEMNDLLVQLPNVPHSSVKAGNSEADNEIVKEGGIMPKLPENSLPHWELGKK